MDRRGHQPLQKPILLVEQQIDTPGEPIVEHRHDDHAGRQEADVVRGLRDLHIRGPLEQIAEENQPEQHRLHEREQHAELLAAESSHPPHRQRMNFLPVFCHDVKRETLKVKRAVGAAKNAPPRPFVSRITHHTPSCSTGTSSLIDRPVWAMNTSSNRGRWYSINSSWQSNRLADSRIAGSAFSGDSTRISRPVGVAFTARIAGCLVNAAINVGILLWSFKVNDTISPPSPIFSSAGAPSVLIFPPSIMANRSQSWSASSK